MKGNLNNKFGIHKVELISRQYIGSLVFREQGIENCLVAFKYKKTVSYKV